MSIGLGLLGAIGSIYSTASQNQNIDEQIKAQQQENQQAAFYNLNLARLQNQWNLDQWNRENAYNSPSAIAARMDAAGLNRDLMYADGGTFTPSATSPEMTAGSGYTPADMSNMAQKKTYGQVIADATSVALAAAQTKKAETESGKVTQETENLKVQNQILSADALVKAASAESVIEYNKAKVYVAHNTAELTHAQSEYYAGLLNKVAAETEKTYKEIDKMVAEIGEIDQRVVQMKFDRYMRSKEFGLACQNLFQQIKESDSRIALNYQEVKRSVQMTMAEVCHLNFDTRLKIQQRKNLVQEEYGIEIANDAARFNFDQSKKWDDKQRRASVASAWMTGIGICLGGFTQFAKTAASFAVPSPAKIGFK